MQSLTRVVVFCLPWRGGTVSRQSVPSGVAGRGGACQSHCGCCWFGFDSFAMVCRFNLPCCPVTWFLCQPRLASPGARPEDQEGGRYQVGYRSAHCVHLWLSLLAHFRILGDAALSCPARRRLPFLLRGRGRGLGAGVFQAVCYGVTRRDAVRVAWRGVAAQDEAARSGLRWHCVW